MKSQRKQRPSKFEGVLRVVRDRVESGRVDARHFLNRQRERRVSYPQILYVFKNGWHESRKDEWKEAYGPWNHAIRGKAAEGIETRVPVFLIRGGPCEPHRHCNNCKP